MKPCLRSPVCLGTRWPCLGSPSPEIHPPKPAALPGADHRTWQQLVFALPLLMPHARNTGGTENRVSRANPASAASPRSRRFFCWRTVLFNVLFQTLSFPPGQLPCLTVCSRDIRVWPGFSTLALSQARRIHFLGLMHQGLPRRG